MAENADYCGTCGWVVPSTHLCRLVAAEKRLKAEIERLRAKVREAMGECGTSTTTHHLLREIVPDWRSAAVTCCPCGDPTQDEYECRIEGCVCPCHGLNDEVWCAKHGAWKIGNPC